MCGLVCPSRTSEREGEGYCVKGGWQEGEERVRRSVNPIPNPDPNPSSADVCFITAGPITKLFAWGEEESGGHVL